MIPEGMKGGCLVPLNIAFLDLRDVRAANLSPREAAAVVAGDIKGPAGINLFDMDAVTTTSDGIMVDGAIILMAASDYGRINRDFGILEMEEIPFSKELIKEEPHLAQWEKNYPGRALYRGPDPKKKIIPVHNVVITGRASNNNSATEMMNIVTMEEILLPILGQMQIMKGGKVTIGMTGEVISVGIGMTVAEQYGRVFPTRQFRAGQTAHGCGQYAKTLKRDIPCIAARKAVLAEYIEKALDCGMVPARDISCSPAVLAVAKYRGYPIDLENISKIALEELASVGITEEYLNEKVPPVSKEELIDRADEIIPGLPIAAHYEAADLIAEHEAVFDEAVYG